MDRSRLDNIRDVRLQTFSPLLTQQTPVLFPQPTTLALGRCQRQLNGSPYGHLHIKQPPRYTVNRTHIYIAIQRACCPPVYSLLNVPCSLLYDLLPFHGMWLLDHNQWGRSRSPKMLSIALVYTSARAEGSLGTRRGICITKADHTEPRS